MSDTILNSIDIYKTYDCTTRHKYFYEEFEKKVNSDSLAHDSYYKLDGFGEAAFAWIWKLLVDDMKSPFSFCEVGVYKGRVLAQVAAFAQRTNKSCTIYGVSPLSTTGDKYSSYDNIDYVEAIQNNFKKLNASMDSTTLIKGYSNDIDIINKVKTLGPFDIVYIDGCHDYDIVISDLEHYSAIVKSGGYLVMDDASLYIEHPFGRFLGHPDVSKAATDFFSKHSEFEHVLAIGHNRLWRKN